MGQSAEHSAGTGSARFAQIVGWVTVVWAVLAVPVAIITVLGR